MYPAVVSSAADAMTVPIDTRFPLPSTIAYQVPVELPLIDQPLRVRCGDGELRHSHRLIERDVVIVQDQIARCVALNVRIPCTVIHAEGCAGAARTRRGRPRAGDGGLASRTRKARVRQRDRGEQ